VVSEVDGDEPMPDVPKNEKRTLIYYQYKI